MPSRAAFRWTRSPNGWTRATFGPASIEDNVPDEPGDYETLDDLLPGVAVAADDASDPSTTLARVWTRPCTTLLGAQAEVDSIADEWAKLWEEQGVYEHSVLPNDERPPPLPGMMFAALQCHSHPTLALVVTTLRRARSPGCR